MNSVAMLKHKRTVGDYDLVASLHSAEKNLVFKSLTKRNKSFTDKVTFALYNYLNEKATQKRPVNADDIVTEIENELYNSLTKEVTTAQIGEMVMEKLKSRDQVAYVRFASVYREFTDVEHFLSELMELKSDKKGE